MLESTGEWIRRTAVLAGLDLGNEEEKQLASDLARVLEFMDALHGLELTEDALLEVEPESPLWREDEIECSKEAFLIRRNCGPLIPGPYIPIPRVNPVEDAK